MHSTVHSGFAQINDVSAGSSDPELLSFVASRGLPIIIMHSRGTPSTMDDLVSIRYGRCCTENSI